MSGTHTTRSPGEICETGAAWVSETELAWLCDCAETLARIVSYEIDESKSAARHFAEVRRMAREIERG